MPNLEERDKSRRNFLNVDPELNFAVIRGLSSPVRIQILKLLQRKGPMNVNQISDEVSLPQSTVATHIQILQESALIDTQTLKATKGQQKICSARYDEIVIRLDEESSQRFDNTVEVSMPHGAVHQLRCQRAMRHVLNPSA